MPETSATHGTKKSTKAKLLTKLPRAEHVWEVSLSSSGICYYVTSNRERTKYYLYKRTKAGKYKRIASAKTPGGFRAKRK